MPPRRHTDLYGWGWKGPGLRQRYSNLNRLGAEASDLAAIKPHIYDKVVAFFEELISNQHLYENEEYADRRFDNEDAHEFGGHDVIIIGDPKKVNSKGAPKQNKKGRKEENPPLTKNGRPRAFYERKKCLCGICKTSGHNRRGCSQNPK